MDFIVRELMQINGLQITPAYKAHIRDRNEKPTDVDPEFYLTPVMKTENERSQTSSCDMSSRGLRPTGFAIESVGKEDSTRHQSSVPVLSVDTAVGNIIYSPVKQGQTL